MTPNYDYPWNFPNFTPEEVACKCGCGFMPTEYALWKLQELRYEYNAPLVITSGARCYAHNLAVGGARESYHKKGEAFDVRVNRDTVNRLLYEVLDTNVFKGRGLSLKGYWGFLHIDLRDVEKFWTY